MRKRGTLAILSAFLFLIMISSMILYAGEVNIPKTGQINSYAAGDDGDLEMGLAWPSPRFTDNGDGTVTDNLTALVWLKNMNCFGQQTWADALASAATLNSGECGLSDGSVEGDWRLPSITELYSLIDTGRSSPALPIGHPFTGVQFGYYWSSTTYPEMTSYAWSLSMGAGSDMLGDKVYNPNYAVMVRSSSAFPAEVCRTGQTVSYASGDDGALQAGHAWPVPRFADNSDGTVTDNLTGLIWLKNANCFGTQTWANAISGSNTLNSGECGLSDGSAEGDWRLPNKNELRSLIDYGRYSPALPPDHLFTGIQTGYYWSSSAYKGSSSQVWCGDIPYGRIPIGTKTSSYYFLPVRSPAFFSLYVSTAGTGSGTVTSSPAGIDCGATCSVSFAKNQIVTLSAEPGPDSSFAGWSGDCNSGGQVTMDSVKHCTATFNSPPRTLTVTKSGTGTGAVTADGCTLEWTGDVGTCTVQNGTMVTLHASPGYGSEWDGWSGGYGSASGCTGTEACPFDMTQDSGVIADFSLSAVAPEVSGEDPYFMMIAKNGTNPNNLDLTIQDVGTANYNIYVSNSPITHPFQVSSASFGKIECAATIDDDLGEMLEILDFDLESGITGDTSMFFILVTADRGSAGTEGTAGHDSDDLERSADSTCF